VSWLAERSPHTRTGYFRDLAHYLAWCQREGLDPRVARPADLSQYRAELEQPGGGAGPAPATVHRRLSAISSWYRYLLASGAEGVAANPVAGTRRPAVDRDASATVGLTVAEVQALLGAADRAAQQRAGRRPTRYLAALRDRALLRLLADLGLRIGEALALDVDALSYNRGRRTVRYRGKGGRQRERPLSAHALEALDDYLAARDGSTGPLFATTGRATTGQASTGRATTGRATTGQASTDRTGAPGRLTEPAAFRMIRRVAAAAGLPAAGRLSPHSLRHAFATNARELGIPLEDVQDAMGHADARTTRRYDRGRYALHRDPALRLGDQYAQRPTG